MTDESGQAGLRIAADARPPRPHRDRHCPEPLVATPGFPAQYKAEAEEGAAFLDRLRLEKEPNWTFLSPSALFAAGMRIGKFRRAATSS